MGRTLVAVALTLCVASMQASTLLCQVRCQAHAGAPSHTEHAGGGHGAHAAHPGHDHVSASGPVHAGHTGSARGIACDHAPVAGAWLDTASRLQTTALPAEGARVSAPCQTVSAACRADELSRLPDRADHSFPLRI